MGECFEPESVDDKTMRTQPVSFDAKLLHEKYGIGESADEVAEWMIELSNVYVGSESSFAELISEIE
jgi:hypothetical protein